MQETWVRSLIGEDATRHGATKPMKVKVESDSLRPHGLLHRILQARILESVAFLFSRGSSQPRDLTQISCIVDGFFTQLSHKGSQEHWSG